MSGVDEHARRDREFVAWSGKRATLEGLRPSLRTARVPDGFPVSFARWRDRRAATVEGIANRSSHMQLAVRSDRAGEDSASVSSAGRYRTCLDVDGSDRRRIAAAVDAVFASYAPARAADEVFIQRQITPVRDAIVASTHALPDGAAYRVLSIAAGPRSDEVTRGAADVDTWYLARDSTRPDSLPAHWRPYLRTLLEVEHIVGTQPCEVEMVADQDGDVWLLQVRPLIVRTQVEPALIALRQATEAGLRARSQASPLLGMMPDWNPAELLGEHPRPLARDLFDALITRRAWRIGRSALGHADVGDVGLLQIHAGRPYVDVRTSLRSLLPASVAAAIGERMVDAYCRRLRAYPVLHDKIEFEIAFTAAHPGIEDRIESRYPGVLDARERSAFAHALRAPTRAALDGPRVQRLRGGFLRDLHSPVPRAHPARLRHALARLELRSAVRFATAARMAFAVEALLRTAVDEGALDATRLTGFKQSALVDPALPWLRAEGDMQLTRNAALGHIRAGTFDLAVPARREILAHAFASASSLLPAGSAALAPTAQESAYLQRMLEPLDIAMSPVELLVHYRRLLQLRELGKFALARGVSLLLDALQAHAASLDIGREDAGWLPLRDLLDADMPAAVLQTRIVGARQQHQLESRLRMPLLLDRFALDSIHYAPGQANYLGNGLHGGPPIRVDAHTHPDSVPLHAIIVIASADPGFDWIFLRRPAALVTAFGGPNSHMAIRCAESGVPALLGVGPERFRRLADAPRITINFDARTCIIG
ncbi:MAG: PEP-utilizing enzyme [Dokdonella sp.]